jgi:hypothetical protein
VRSALALARRRGRIAGVGMSDSPGWHGRGRAAPIKLRPGQPGPHL